MIKDLNSNEELDKAIEDSKKAPVYIYKHSSSCNISAGAWREVQAISNERPEIEFRRIMVRENKILSREIAEKLGVEHQSPQIILVNKGVPVWSATHYAITSDTILGALKFIESEE